MDALLLILKKYSLLIALFGGIFGLLLILVIYIISILSNKRLEFKIGKIQFSTGKAKEIGNVCPNKQDDGSCMELDKIETFLKIKEHNTISLIKSAVILAEEKTHDIDKLRFIETITRQLVVAEDVNIRIKSLLLGGYNKLAQNKTEIDFSKQDKDYRYYQVILSTILNELKNNTIKDGLKSTDITILDEAEFDLFVENKSEIMMAILIEYLDFMYNKDSIVSLQELHIVNNELKHEIKKILRSMYQQIKKIILHDRETVDSIEKHFKIELDSLKNVFKSENILLKLKKELE